MKRPKTPYWPLACICWLGYRWGSAFHEHGFTFWVVVSGLALGLASGIFFEQLDWKSPPKDDS